MKRTTRMMLMAGDQKKRDMDWDDRRERMPEDKYRDRTGREHYDNGRFAPRSEGPMYPMDDPIYPVYNTHRTPTYYPDPEEYRWKRPMQKIGFSVDGEMGRASEFRQEHPMDASYSHMDETGYRTGEQRNGYAMGGVIPMTKEMAEEWVHGMENEDGTTGPHWSLDQAKKIMAQRGIQGSPYDFYAVINSIYSDFCKVARKFGVGDKIDFYAEMAKAWLDDADAEPEKASRYFEYIVRK